MQGVLSVVKGEGCPGTENGRYANHETALMFPIVFLGESAAAARLERAVLGVLADERDLTLDLGGTGTTESVTDSVVAHVRRRSSDRDRAAGRGTYDFPC